MLILSHSRAVRSMEFFNHKRYPFIRDKKEILWILKKHL